MKIRAKIRKPAEVEEAPKLAKPSICFCNTCAPRLSRWSAHRVAGSPVRETATVCRKCRHSKSLWLTASEREAGGPIHLEEFEHMNTVCRRWTHTATTSKMCTCVCTSFRIT